MRSKIMIAYFILKVLTAFSIPMFLIVTFDLTRSGTFVGLTSFLLAFGNITGNVYWHKILKRRRVFLFSYLSFVSLILLLSKNIWIVLFPSYTFSFFNCAGYISLLVSKSIEKNPKARLAKLEKFGGIAYLIGLALGFTTKLFPFYYLIFLIQFTSILSITIIYKTIRRELKKEISKGLFILEDLIVKPPKLFVSFSLTLMKSLSLLSSTFFRFKKPSSIKFHLMFILFFLSSGMIIPQVVTVIKSARLHDIWVYASYVVGSSFALLGYYAVQKSKSIDKIAVSSMTIRIFLFLSFFALASISGLYLIVAVLLFRAIQGITWGVLLVWFNYVVLKKKRSELGANLSIRSFSSSIGGLVGGLFFDWSIIGLSVVSSLLMCLSAFSYRLTKR